MRSHEEFRLACYVRDLLDRCACKDVLWTHFPAGEHRNAVTGARLKRMGAKSGWPDYLFVEPGAHVSFLELKSGKGRLSPEQQAFKLAAEALGCRYAVARNGDQATNILAGWGILELRIAA